jgi:hypothetical protein
MLVLRDAVNLNVFRKKKKQNKLLQTLQLA